MLSAGLSVEDYQFLLHRDFTSFIERSFYELNPQTRLLLGPHIEVIATKLEACRQGRIKRLIVNLPPRHLKSHLRLDRLRCLVSWAPSSRSCHLRQLRSGPGR